MEGTGSRQQDDILRQQLERIWCHAHSNTEGASEDSQERGTPRLLPPFSTVGSSTTRQLNGRPYSYPSYTPQRQPWHAYPTRDPASEKIHTPACERHRWEMLRQKDVVSRERMNFLLSRSVGKSDSNDDDSDARPSYIHNDADDVFVTISDEFCICHARNV